MKRRRYRAAVIDKVGGDDVVPGLAKHVNDRSTTAGGLPYLLGEILSAQKRGRRFRWRFVEIVAAV